MIIEETVTFKLSNSKFAILGIFCPIFSVPKIMFLAPENKKTKQVLKFSSEKNINENNHNFFFSMRKFFFCTSAYRAIVLHKQHIVQCTRP